MKYLPHRDIDTDHSGGEVKKKRNTHSYKSLLEKSEKRRLSMNKTAAVLLVVVIIEGLILLSNLIVQ